MGTLEIQLNGVHDPMHLSSLLWMHGEGPVKNNYKYNYVFSKWSLCVSMKWAYFLTGHLFVLYTILPQY